MIECAPMSMTSGSCLGFHAGRLKSRPLPIQSLKASPTYPELESRPLPIQSLTAVPYLSFSRLSFSPGSYETSHHHQLAHVIRRMVRDQQEFSEKRLALSNRNFSQQVALWIANHFLQRLPIMPVRRHTRIPGLRVGRLGR